MGKFHSKIAGSLGCKCPKQVLRKIDRQLARRSKFRISTNIPMPFRIRQEFESIIVWNKPTDDLFYIVKSDIQEEL